MAVHPKIQALSNYLMDPKVNQLPLTDPAHNFLISYLGNLFIQGFRVFEYLNNYTIALELAQQQKFILIHYEMDIINDRSKRQQIWKQLMQLVELINIDAQVHVLYLKCQKYSVMNIHELKSFRLPDCHIYPPSCQFLPLKKGYKHIDVKQQGTKLHAMIEYFLKGQTIIHNMDSFQRQTTGRDGQVKFSYELNRIINTLKLIVGREMIQNNYHVMSSEKWMRKKTKKVFKRFDLILRNQNKICIIDWKFSRISAHQKINTRAFVKKNQLYLQLAKKDYKSQVQLKFYCIHTEIMMDQYHKFTQAYYDYKIDEIMIDEEGKQDDDADDEQVVFFDGEMEKFIENQDHNGLEVGKKTALENFRIKYGIEEEKTQQNPYKVIISNENSTKKRLHPTQCQNQQQQHPNVQEQSIAGKKKQKPDQQHEPKVKDDIKHKRSKKSEKKKKKSAKRQETIILIDDEADEQSSEDVVFIEKVVNISSEQIIGVKEQINPENEKQQQQKPCNDKQCQKLASKEGSYLDQLSLQYQEINFEVLDNNKPVDTRLQAVSLPQTQSQKPQAKQMRNGESGYRSYIILSSSEQEGEMV